MNRKIGIAIKSTLLGASEPFKYNPGSWDTKVVDIRDVLRHVPSLRDDPERTIVFFSFAEHGCYITVAHCYPNREGDNIAGWIYLPCELRISGHEIVELIGKVRNVIFMPELPDMRYMEEHFGKEHPLLETYAPYQPSPKNGQFAKRGLTATTTRAQIFDALHQDYYGKYQAVFLEEERGEVEDAQDITNLPLRKMVAVTPPDLRGLGAHDVKVYFEQNGDQFDRIMLAPIGATIRLVAKRPGFEPYRWQVKVGDEGTRIEIPHITWQKEIKPTDFIVQDPTGRRISNGYSIVLNGQKLVNVLYFQESELERVNVKVVYDGKEYPAGDLDLRHTPQTISLAAISGKGQGMEWKIRLADGTDSKIFISGTSLHAYDSPLRGYEAVGGRMRYKGSNVWLQRCIGFIAAIVLGGIVVGILAICGVFSDKKDQPEQTPTENTTDAQGAGAENAGNNAFGIQDEKRSEEEVAKAIEEEKAALDYLNNNAKWKRDQMEGMPRLAGLYDAINSFDIETIKKKYGERLKASPRFNGLVGALETALATGWNPRKDDPTKTYSPDGTITVESYINWVKESSTKASQQTPPANTQKKGQGANTERQKQGANKQGTIQQEESGSKSGNKPGKRGSITSS